MSNGEIAGQKKQDITVGKDPELVLSEAKKACIALTKVIDGRKKKLILNDKTYLFNEDWQTIGKFYNLCAQSHDAEPFEVGRIEGAKATADIMNINTGMIVGSAIAYCMRDEPNWQKKPWFQLASMAQTRACSKAFKNVLAWVVVLAGYEPTPAEEMTDIADRKPPIKQPEAKKPEPTPTGDVITEPQRKRLFAISKTAKISAEDMKAFLKSYGFESSNDITKDKYKEICEKVEAGKVHASTLVRHSFPVIEGCLMNPMECDHSEWIDKYAYCKAQDGKVCKFDKENPLNG